MKKKQIVGLIVWFRVQTFLKKPIFIAFLLFSNTVCSKWANCGALRMVVKAVNNTEDISSLSGEEIV